MINLANNSPIKTSRKENDPSVNKPVDLAQSGITPDFITRLVRQAEPEEKVFDSTIVDPNRGFVPYRQYVKSYSQDTPQGRFQRVQLRHIEQNNKAGYQAGEDKAFMLVDGYFGPKQDQQCELVINLDENTQSGMFIWTDPSSYQSKKTALKTPQLQPFAQLLTSQISTWNLPDPQLGKEKPQ